MIGMYIDTTEDIRYAFVLIQHWQRSRYSAGLLCWWSLFEAHLQRGAFNEVKNNLELEYENFILIQLQTLQVGTRLFKSRSIIFQIVKLQDFFPDQDTVCLVFEYMDSGLWELLHDKKIQLSVSHMKTYVQMLLKGVSYLHGKFIMHRVSPQKKENFFNSINSVLLLLKRYMN